MNNKKVWLVTGASKGIGLSLVKKLLAQGYRVAATSRKANDLEKAVGNNSEAFLPLAVDITSEQSVGIAIEQTVTRFGRIDIIVNNAGYGQLGALEELSDAEARTNFDVNVFGSLNVIRKAMPHLRKQGSGYIVNIASIAGYSASFPGWGIYCATKFAVVGFTESLAEEVKEFGIKVTVVLPGYFRTNFLDAGSLNTPAHPLAQYTAVRHLEDLHVNSIKGNQPGNPEKAADVLIKMSEEGTPPLHLFLGEDAQDIAAKKATDMQSELAQWENLGKETAFAEVAMA